MRDSYEPEVVWSRHFAVAPLIEVDGDTASGRWQGLLMSVVRKDNDGEEMLWAAGTSDETYCRIGGRWLFASVSASARWMSDFQEGMIDR